MKSIIVVLLFFCVACSNPIHHKYKGNYRIGTAYTINGETYYPTYYDKYEETGIASWYNEDCGKCSTHDECKPCITANGEFFNKNGLTAAHRTLPMPNIVKVTNLNNGKVVKLKVNDRGPFKNNRILDVTEKAAQELGFKEHGLAMVKVEYLKRSTEKLIHSRPHYKKSYRRIMRDLNNRRSIFSHNVKKISEEKNFYLPDRKKVERTIKQIFPTPKQVMYKKLYYNVSTGYNKSNRF